MRVLLVCPLYEAVPPTHYGGTERVVANLSRGLAALGCSPVLCVAGGSACGQPSVEMRDLPLRVDRRQNTSGTGAHIVMMHDVQRLEKSFDILHFHTEIIHFPFFEHVAAKTVTTVHGSTTSPSLQANYRRWSAYDLVAVSMAQAKEIPDARWRATIYNGIDFEVIPFVREPEQILAFVGRLSPDKGPQTAIKIAQYAGMPLRMAAKLDSEDTDFFFNELKPLIDDDMVKYVGEVGDQGKFEMLGNAVALLMPISWSEPFGLVMIEAMACGTPVVAFDRGSVREVVDDGVTGFIVSSIEEAVTALARVRTLDRATVRAQAARRFSTSRMASAYAAIYEDICRARCGSSCA